MTKGTKRVAPLTVPVERFALRAVALLVLMAAAGVGFALLVVSVRLRWAPLRDLDRAVADALTGLVAGDEVLTEVLHGVTTLGGMATLLWLTCVGVGWLLVRRQLWVAIYVAVTAFGAAVLGVVVEQLVVRLRPIVELPVSLAPGPSFPSGHALGSIVTYGVLVLVFLPVVRRSARWAPAGAAALVVVVIGVTRIVLGVHLPTDVLGGWLLGAVWLVLTAAVFRRWRAEVGVPEVPLSEGVAPEAAPDIRPAPRSGTVLPRRGVAELVVGWGVLAGVLYGAGRLVVGDWSAAAWDAAVVQWFTERRSPGLDVVLVPLGQLGGTAWVVGAAFVVGPLALALSRSWSPVLFLASTLVGGISLVLLTTVSVARPGPDVPLVASDRSPGSGFPSGHVAAAVALYGATALLVFSATSRWWRWFFVAVAVVVSGLVAVQRLYTGAQYPTDVLGGVLLAVMWTALVWWVVRPDHAMRAVPRRAQEEPPP
ncbi:phosphatase PAP2 family protein [Saccharothrix isguenensis]